MSLTDSYGKVKSKSDLKTAALLAWLLVVLVFYFKLGNLLFDYFSFLIRHRGSFSLWHSYSLKALGAFGVAIWLGWTFTRCGRWALRKLLAPVVCKCLLGVAASSDGRTSATRTSAVQVFEIELQSLTLHCFAFRGRIDLLDR